MIAGVISMRLILSLAVGWLSVFFLLPVWAKLSASEVLRIIGESKILAADSNVQAAVHPDEKEVEISATRDARATDKDCKIDAVLIAKKVMDVDSDGVAKVKVTFFDAANRTSFRKVTVRAGDVKAFAARSISQEMLLSELELVSGQETKSAGDPAALPAVVDGPLHNERAALLRKIQDLQEQGVGTAPFLALFAKVESAAGKGDSAGAAQLLLGLGKAVDDQSRHLNNLRQSQQLQSARRLGGKNKFAVPEMQKLLSQSSTPLGDLAPVTGPFPVRRIRVAHKLKELQASGHNTQAYLQAYRQIEALVKAGDNRQVEVLLRKLEGALGLPSIIPPRLAR